ncbi:hypothetical protein ACIGO6_25820 [Streptomyces sp. NPDC053750]|uniref:hypothetical protein n=1 Tax=Streptomyces sp. NPDC053750 TaxID=3365714 RepID=UPI0037D559C4
MTVRPFTRVALVGARALALLGPLTATTAAAVSDGGRGPDRVPTAPYAVEPYETVNVRSGPARSYDKVGSAAAGRPRGACCSARCRPENPTRGNHP